MLRSRLRPVFSIEPCVNSVRTEPTREPRPILPTSPPASAEIRSANSTRAALKPVVPTLAMLLPMTESAAPVLMRPLRPVDSAPKIAIPVSSSGAVARVVYLSHLIERDRVAAHQQRGRVGRQVDAVDRRLGQQAERGRGGRARLRSRDLEAVAAVGQRRAERTLPVECEGVLTGALGAEFDDAHRAAIGGTHRRGHLVAGLGDGVAHRRGLPAMDDERAAVEADPLAEQVEQRGAARVLRLAGELVEPVVYSGQLLELGELRELSGQLIGLERREWVLVLELRDEELEALLLADGPALRPPGGRGGGRDALEERAADAADAHARRLRPPRAGGSRAAAGAAAGTGATVRRATGVQGAGPACAA